MAPLIHRSFLRRPLIWGLSLFIALTQGHAAFAMGAAELVTRLHGEAPPTLIDVRLLTQYEQGRIPQAIHIPAAVLPHRQLPPLGAVVVYGDGLDEGAAAAAVDALNQKEGIRAERLDGGILAWEELEGSTRLETGLTPLSPQFISLERLSVIAPRRKGVILVDLRSPAEGLSPMNAGPLAGANLLSAQGQGSSDARVKGAAAFVQGHWRRGGERLFVLIDDGDGLAESVAQRLMSAGVRRVVVLTGGELALKHEGQPETRVIRSGGMR